VVPHVRAVAADRGQPGEIGILPDRRLSPAATAAAAADLIVLGVMHELAALVETVLHHLADRLAGEGESALLQKRSPSWHSSLTAIERECVTRASLIAGWETVSGLRREVNAAKHQGGFLFEPEPLPHFRTVTVAIADPEGKLDDVERWLVGVTDIVDRHLGLPPRVV